MDNVWSAVVGQYWLAAHNGSYVNGIVTNGVDAVAEGRMDADIEVDSKGFRALRLRGTLDRRPPGTWLPVVKMELTVEYLVQEDPGTTRTTIVPPTGSWSSDGGLITSSGSYFPSPSYFVRFEFGVDPELLTALGTTRYHPVRIIQLP